MWSGCLATSIWFAVVNTHEPGPKSDTTLKWGDCQPCTGIRQQYTLYAHILTLYVCSVTSRLRLYPVRRSMYTNKNPHGVNIRQIAVIYDTLRLKSTFMTVHIDVPKCNVCENDGRRHLESTSIRPEIHVVSEVV